MPGRTHAASMVWLSAVCNVLVACVGGGAPRDEDGRLRTVSPDRPGGSILSGGDFRRTAGAEIRCSARGEDISISRALDAETTLYEVLHAISDHCGAELVLDDACRRRLERTTVFLCGEHRVRRPELFEWLTAVLSCSGVSIVPSEPEAHGAHPRWTCIVRRTAAGSGRSE